MIKTGPTPEISSKLMRSKKFFPFKSSPSAAIAAAECKEAATPYVIGAAIAGFLLAWYLKS